MCGGGQADVMILSLPSDAPIFTALKAWLEHVLGFDTNHVIQELNNRVPTPTVPFALMTHISQDLKAIPAEVYTSTASMVTFVSSIDFVIQVDLFGPQSGGQTMALNALFRSGEAIRFLGQYGVAPLYADRATEAHFVNGEDQYEERWLTRLHLQYKPVVSASMDFFSHVTIDLVKADVEE